MVNPKYIAEAVKQFCDEYDLAITSAAVEYEARKSRHKTSSAKSTVLDMAVAELTTPAERTIDVLSTMTRAIGPDNAYMTNFPVKWLLAEEPEELPRPPQSKEFGSW